jgi:Tfp pilus assembly protein PilW
MSFSVDNAPVKLSRDQRGTSVIELAIAAPVLLIFLAGVTDLGRGFSERYRLQQAVNRTLEMAQTGKDADYAFLKTEAVEAAGVPAENVVQEQWVECGGAPAKKAWSEDCAGAESARFVKLTIIGSYMPLFGSMAYLNKQPDGTVKLTAHATLRVR